METPYALTNGQMRGGNYEALPCSLIQSPSRLPPVYKSITIEDHLVLKAMVTIKGNDDQEDKYCNNMKALVGIQMQ